MSIRLGDDEQLGGAFDFVKKIGRGVKAVGRGAGGLGLKVVKSRAAWKVAAIAAGAAFGIPPGAMATAFDYFVKTGKFPAGTDEKTKAAILKTKPAWWQEILGFFGIGG